MQRNSFGFFSARNFRRLSDLQPSSCRKMITPCNELNCRRAPLRLIPGSFRWSRETENWQSSHRARDIFTIRLSKLFGKLINSDTWELPFLLLLFALLKATTHNSKQKQAPRSCPRRRLTHNLFGVGRRVAVGENFCFMVRRRERGEGGGIVKWNEIITAKSNRTTASVYLPRSF